MTADHHPSFRTTVGCAQPTCTSRREYAYGADMSRMLGDLGQHGWVSKRIGAQTHLVCPSHLSYDGTQPSQALREYVKGDTRHLDGIRASRQTDTGPAAFSEASAVALRIRKDSRALPTLEELVRQTGIALAVVRSCRGQEIPRWEVETVVLRMIANGDLVLVEFEHGGRLRSAYRETKQGPVHFQAATATGPEDLAFMTWDNTISIGTPFDGRPVTHGSSLAWVEQVADVFPGISPETMTASYDTPDDKS